MIFVVIGIGLVALRHSSYGRRLTAMKDSPAAAATLGPEPGQAEAVRLHALGGHRRAGRRPDVRGLGQRQRRHTYIIFISLALVMLTVVGGIGNVAGALIGGVLAGTGFQALTSTFQNLARTTAAGASGASWPTSPWWPRRSIGISLGRNPSGAVGQIVASYRPLWQGKGGAGPRRARSRWPPTCSS